MRPVRGRERIVDIQIAEAGELFGELRIVRLFARVEPCVLQQENITALQLGDGSFRLKKSFELAERAGARWVIIVGEDEAASNTFTVKDLRSGEQSKVERSSLAAHIR